MPVSAGVRVTGYGARVDVVVAELRRVAVESPEVVRIVVGLLGAIVLFAGARLYRKALFFGCFGAGAIGGVLLLDLLSGWSADLARPVVLIAGGQGAWNAPELIYPPEIDTSRIRWIMPDRYCRCAPADHDCDKEISDFAPRFRRALEEVAA